MPKRPQKIDVKSARKPISKPEVTTVASTVKPPPTIARRDEDSPTTYVIGDAEEDFQILE